MTLQITPESAPRGNSHHISLPTVSANDLFLAATSAVREDLNEVERLLRNLLSSRVEGVPEMMAYLIELGGKRVRPLLSLLIARACGYRGKSHYIVACVAELLHTATLYHDDVVDEAELRRGKRTANHVFGNKVTVLAGDLMLAHSFSLLMDGGYFSVSRTLSRTVRLMVEGEILQLQCEENYDTTVDQYRQVIENKTASLFAWSSQSAALLADLTPERAETFWNFGFHIGIAFQLVDDLLDFSQEAATFGKEPLQDLKNGKVTLPLLLLLDRHPEIREELKRESSGPGRARVMEQVRDLVLEGPILADCHAIIGQHLEEARHCLGSLSPSIYRTALATLVEFLEVRER